MCKKKDGVKEKWDRKTLSLIYEQSKNFIIVYVMIPRQVKKFLEKRGDRQEV